MNSVAAKMFVFYRQQRNASKRVDEGEIAIIFKVTKIQLIMVLKLLTLT